ncbi:aspartate kinase [Flavobacteriaceae bacterium]|nr:aspartate kinase [Flavobacteriaceae bacterium]
MKVYKFGGASVKDAEGIRNVCSILETVGYQDTLIVVSAMGKTTNALELVVENYFKNPSELATSILEVKQYHLEVIHALFEAQAAPVLDHIQRLFEELNAFLKVNKSPDYSFLYDQVVSYGELLSTTIIHLYLQHKGIQNQWLDARTTIKTDDYYRGANLDWKRTQEAILASVSKKELVITQGFIGSDANNFTTTLGREGSDYSAAIFAFALNAVSVTIWKDVAGVLNGDPRVFEDTVLLHQISYREAIELAFYGASVIHPKTLQPLQRKEIPLFVRSFENPTAVGTAVSKGKTLEPHVPCYIVKKDQVLLRLSSLDFSFIVEDNISDIFALLHQYKMRVELIQNSAISFSVCFTNKYDRLEDLLGVLRSRFNVEVTENVSLYTVRHFDATAIQKIQKNGNKVLLEQRTSETAQFVMA